MNILSIVPFCLLLMIPICTSAEEKVERTDAEWDEILSGITIESATPEPDPALEGKKSKTHIRSNYSGLEKGRPPKQGSSYQEKNFKNATNAASTEAIDVEMQLMTESIDDLIPIEGGPHQLSYLQSHQALQLSLFLAVMSVKASCTTNY